MNIDDVGYISLANITSCSVKSLILNKSGKLFLYLRSHSFLENHLLKRMMNIDPLVNYSTVG